MHPVSLRLLWAVAAVAAVWCQPASAQYRWKDGLGQVYASDLPPPREIPDKDILQRPQAGGRATTAAVAAPALPVAGTSVAKAASSPLDPELEGRRKRAEDQARARARADEERQAAQRADNCRRARDQLAMLENGQRLVRFNAQGERVVVDDATRANDADTARQVMASDCR